MKIRKLYRYFYKLIVGKLNPVKYAKKVGVNMGGGTPIRHNQLGLRTMDYHAGQ